MNITNTIYKYIVDQKIIDMKSNLEALNTDIFTNKNNIIDITSNISSLSENNSIIGKDVYNDIEFFRCFTDKNSKNNTVFDKVNNTFLQGSNIILKELLNKPIYDKVLLEKRQNILQKTFEENNTSLTEELRKIKQFEVDVLWLFEDIDPDLKDLYNMAFFKFSLLKPLNRYSSCITAYNYYRIICSPLIGILSPLLYFIIPYLILRFKFKNLKISFTSYVKVLLESLLHGDDFLMGGGGGNKKYKYIRLISYVFSMIFYFQGIFNSVEISRTLYKVSSHIVQRVNNIITFVKSAVLIINKYWSEDIIGTFINQCENICSTIKEESYISTLKSNPFSLHTNFGQQLSTYLTLDKDILKSILNKIYIIDSLSSMITFKTNNKLCYTLYQKNNSTSINNKPVYKVESIFHPCLSSNNVVKNNISLSKNAILTGSNAAGKSTFAKSLLINTVFSQTFGISVSDSCLYTPFKIISSQILIPDSKGYESLFEAEMYRCKDKLDQLKTLDINEYAFFVMDEIFNSTNPVEAISGAFAIAKKISEYTNCIFVFTTHYIYLTKLQKETKKFINYKFDVIKNGDDIIYPYILSKGISRQYIALDLLKKNSFDKDIIDEALKIKDKLCSK